MLKPLFAASIAALLTLSGCQTSECCGTCGGKSSASPTDEDAGWTVLFDGSSTEHFRGYKMEGFPEQGWVIDGDTLQIKAKSRVPDLITKQKYGDFDLTFEWKVSDGANSGVMYRVAEGKGAAYFTGPEYQILEDSKHGDGKNAKTSSGALYALIACNDKKTLNEPGEWNSTRIKIEDKKVEHWLNGEKVVEYVWGSDEIKALIADSKFKKWERFMKEDTGHIAFQNHNDAVWFRNIKIKNLDDAE